MYTCPRGHTHDLRQSVQMPDGTWKPACPQCLAEGLAEAEAAYDDPAPATPPQQDPAVAPPMMPAAVTQRTSQEPGALQSPHVLRPPTSTEPGVPPAPASPAEADALAGKRARLAELQRRQEEAELDRQIAELEGQQDPRQPGEQPDPDADLHNRIAADIGDPGRFPQSAPPVEQDPNFAPQPGATPAQPGNLDADAFPSSAPASASAPITGETPTGG